MNKENLEKWLVDLETTDEPQTTRVLTDGVGDCCLGRLCKVALADGVPLEVEQKEVGGLFWTNYDGCSVMPPASVYEWLDVDEAAGDIISDCAEWNDDDRLAFGEIAVKIRERIAELYE